MMLTGSTRVDVPETEEQVALLHRRSLRVVAASQVLGGAGLAAGVTVGALLTQDMLGSADVAGLPTGLFTLGSAAAAYGVGALSQRAGRRPGLAAGFFAGSLGAAGIVVAAVVDSPALLFVSLFVYGSGTATNLQARYAGTDLAPEHGRATAVSIAMVFTTFGAVVGPNLVEPTGVAVGAIGVPALAGPFLLAAIAYGLAGLVLLVRLRPDPLLVARAMTQKVAAGPVMASTDGLQPSTGSSVLETDTPHSTSDAASGSRRGVRVGASVMILTQVAMVAIMTMTPVHMRGQGHDLGEVGFVIGVHIGSMFLPSLITGRLVDRFGRVRMAIASALTLLAAGVLSATAPGDSVLVLTLALGLLGLGWNFGLISGTALIVDSTPVSTRARTQGSIDVLIGLAGAGGGAVSGFVVGWGSYAVLSVGGGLLALLLVPVLIWYHRRPAVPVSIG